MQKAMRVAGIALALVAGAVAAQTVSAMAAGTGADDDLAVVRRAVQETPAVTATAGPADENTAEPPVLRTRGKAPQWFKVRIVERGHRRAKVNVNLPIGVVRAMEDWPIDLHCDRHAHVRVKGRDADCSIRLGDLLSGLEAGQDLVTIESDDAHVRVWVE